MGYNLVMTSVYWIRHQDHTDIFTQGYIGVSNNVKKRWYDHNHKPCNKHLSNAIKKYGWDNLVKEVILVAEEAYCFMIESQLRNRKSIGWNITNGGGKPPNAKGIKRSELFKQKQRNRVYSLETRQKKSKIMIGNKNALNAIFTSERKQKISKALKNNKNAQGYQNYLKYILIGTNIDTKETITLIGTKQVKDAGFHHGHILEVCNGKYKTHKNHTWVKQKINKDIL